MSGLRFLHIPAKNGRGVGDIGPSLHEEDELANEALVIFSNDGICVSRSVEGEIGTKMPGTIAD